MALEALGWNAQRQRGFSAHAQLGRVPGRVVSEHRSHLELALDDGEVVAEVPGRLHNASKVRSDLPGVGDFVAVTPSTADGPAIIEAVLPRTSALIRQAVSERRPQLLAANVDTVLIVTTCDGDFNLERIKRYLRLVGDGGAEPVIVINKADIGTGIAAAVEALRDMAPEVALHVLCAHRASEVAALQSYFDGGRTLALLGSSGVGKSTLTNQLLGHEAQETQPVRAYDNRGRHTTTHRQLLVRPGGGAIIDTPGMRGLELWEAETEPVENDAFELIETLAADCKFRNCRHASEPDCAVRAAIARGDLEEALLARYQGE